MTRKKRNLILTIALVLLFTLFGYGAMITEPVRIKTAAPVDFSDGWVYEIDKTAGKTVLRRTITQEMSGKTLSFYTDHARVDVIAAGIPIYSFGTRITIGNSPGSYQHFVSVPKYLDKKELVITVYSVYERHPNTFLNIVMGGQEEVVLHLLNVGRMSFVVNVFLVICGLLLCIMHLISRHSKKTINYATIYLGLMSLFFVSWSSSSLFVNQLVIQNPMVIYMEKYLPVYVLPLVCMCYVGELSPKLEFKFEHIGHLILIMACIGAHMSGVADMTETFPIYVSIAAIEIVDVCVRVIRNTEIEKKFRYGLLSMMFVTLFSGLVYIIKPTSRLDFYLIRVAMCVYMVMALHDALKQMMDAVSIARESKILRKLAFTDGMTNIGNRVAFEQDFRNANITHMSVVVFDLNNLKFYNDHMGHGYGDELIRETVRVIRSVYSKVYRVGGDEFWAVEMDKSPLQMEELSERLLEEIADYNMAGNSDVTIEVAFGMATYMSGDRSYEDLIRRADQKMYEHKSFLKRSHVMKQENSSSTFYMRE